MQIEVPATDELSSLAASRGLARSTAGMHGTLKIIDRAAFLQSLDPRLPPSISALPDAVEELAAAVFGSVERAAASPTSAPLLPLPGYGMNYV